MYLPPLPGDGGGRLITSSTTTKYAFRDFYATADVTLDGIGFKYSAQHAPTGGTITGGFHDGGPDNTIKFSGVSVSVADFNAATTEAKLKAVMTAELGGADTILGSEVRDIINSYGGADSVRGGAGC